MNIKETSWMPQILEIATCYIIQKICMVTAFIEGLNAFKGNSLNLLYFFFVSCFFLLLQGMRFPVDK